MKRSTSKKMQSVIIAIPISIAIAAVQWLILVHLYDYIFGWIGIAATIFVLCGVYWYTIMKWQGGEVFPFMRYARMLVSTVIQMIFLAIAHSIYFRSHSIDRYAPYTAVVSLWFLIAPISLNILTNLTFRQLHRLRVKIKEFRLYKAMIINQISKGRKK